MLNIIKEYNKDFTTEMIKESFFVIDNNYFKMNRE